MRDKITKLFYFGAGAFIIAGLFNYISISYNQITIYEELGGIADSSSIHLEEILTTFGMEVSSVHDPADITVLYISDYPKCAYAIIEIKEYAKLVHEYTKAYDVSVNQFFILLDENTQRAEKELKAINLSLPAAFGFHEEYTRYLQKFGEESLFAKQMIFINKDQKIKYRNKISSGSVIEIDKKKRIISLGVKHAL